MFRELGEVQSAMAKTAEVDKLKEERERIRQRHVQMIQPDRIRFFHLEFFCNFSSFYSVIVICNVDGKSATDLIYRKVIMAFKKSKWKFVKFVAHFLLLAMLR